MHGTTNLAVALGTISVAIVTILFIFNRIDALAKACETNPTNICAQLAGPSLPMITILLILSGLILVIFTVVYIILSAKH